MSSSNDSGLFSYLKTPDWIWDIRKMLAAVNFPVYALANEPLGFRLRHIDLGGSGTSLEVVRINHISLNYAFPNIR